MNFERFYSQLPNFIKYNNFIFSSSIAISKKLRRSNKESEIIDSQHELLELIFLNSNFKITGILRNVQLLYVELLRFVDNVCAKYDIDYWLADGTLLGAVRHGGFIPWDDDIDLALLREDYERLIQVIPKEISRFHYLKDECGLTLLKENFENYFKEFNSVYDIEDENKYMNDEKFLFLQFAWLKPYVKIDFFPIDFIRDDKLDFFNKHYVVTKYEFYDLIKNGIDNFDDLLMNKNNKIGFTNEKTKYLNYSLDSVNYLPPWVFEMDKVFPLNTIEFEGYKFKCPKDNDHYLSVLYGDEYMHLPKVIETHNVAPFIESQFNSVTEMNEEFKKVISYLKNINDNFE